MLVTNKSIRVKSYFIIKFEQKQTTKNSFLTEYIRCMASRSCHFLGLLANSGLITSITSLIGLLHQWFKFSIIHLTHNSFNDSTFAPNIKGIAQLCKFSNIKVKLHLKSATFYTRPLIEQ
jgi:hypothetical protein